jgi:hypothetical protein
MSRPQHRHPRLFSASTGGILFYTARIYRKASGKILRLLQNKFFLIGLVLLLGINNRSLLFKELCREIKLKVQSGSHYNTNEDSLWRGSFPVQELKQEVGRKIPSVNIDLVISHCNQPLSWIFDEWAPSVIFSSITIISKCNTTVLGAPSSAIIVTLPNVGRCDHTYAHYIAGHYKHFSYIQHQEGTYVLFLKDTDNSNRNHYTRHRSLIEMIQISKRYGFACHEEPIWVWAQHSMHYFRPICRISAYHNWTELQAYTLKTYTRLRRDDNSDFISKHGNSLGDYAKQMEIEGPSGDSLVPVCYGGNFMAQSRQLVTSNRSLDLWQRIEASLSRANNIAEGHFVERLWGTLLSKTVEPDLSKQILKQSQRFCLADKNYVGVFTK